MKGVNFVYPAFLSAAGLVCLWEFTGTWLGPIHKLVAPGTHSSTMPKQNRAYGSSWFG